jgi:nitroreductase
MTAKECIKGRRSIRSFKPDAVSPELIRELVETASYSPSWKNTQIIRYVAVTGETKERIANECTDSWKKNADIINNAPVLMVQCYVKGRSGFERDGSYSTEREDRWQMYDAGISAANFCNAAYEAGLGSVILGIFDFKKTAEILALPENIEAMALIPVGCPAELPSAPKRKTVDELLTFMS